MANIYKKEQITICTTPEELRKLADKMEQFWKNVSIGDELVVETWSSDIDILFQIDQEKINVSILSQST